MRLVRGAKMLSLSRANKIMTKTNSGPDFLQAVVILIVKTTCPRLFRDGAKILEGGHGHGKSSLTPSLILIAARCHSLNLPLNNTILKLANFKKFPLLFS